MDVKQKEAVVGRLAQSMGEALKETVWLAVGMHDARRDAAIISDAVTGRGLTETMEKVRVAEDTQAAAHQKFTTELNFALACGLVTRTQFTTIMRKYQKVVNLRNRATRLPGVGGWKLAVHGARILWLSKYSFHPFLSGVILSDEERAEKDTAEKKKRAHIEKVCHINSFLGFTNHSPKEYAAVMELIEEEHKNSAAAKRAALRGWYIDHYGVLEEIAHRSNGMTSAEAKRQELFVLNEWARANKKGPYSD